MIGDAQLRFSLNQPIVAGTTVSSNVIDGISPRSNWGRAGAGGGRLLVAVNTAFAGGTSLQAVYVQSATPDMASPDVLAAGPVIATALLVAGARLLDMPLVTNTKQYLGIQFVAVGGFTAGSVDAGVVADTQYNPLLPANVGQ